MCAALALLSSGVRAQTKVRLATQTTPPGSSGQLLYNHSGAVDAEDPIVSYNYVSLFNAQSATGTATSSVTRVSTFGQYGTLITTWAGITGSPSGCTIQIKSADSQGNLVNNGSAISVTPANGTTASVFTPAATLQTAAQMEAVYACSTTYPSAGTLTLDFVPAISVGIGDGWLVTLGAKADAKSTATDTTAISLMQVLKEMSFMLQNPAALPANQSVNVNQIAGTGPLTAGLVDATPAASSASGDAASSCNILSGASTNATNCKNAAGNFYGYEVYNTTTTIYYLRLYNTSSSPTCSSATGFIRSIPLIPAAAAGGSGGQISNQVVPVNYSTGVSYCITGGSSSTDNTNAATGIFGEIRYK